MCLYSVPGPVGSVSSIMDTTWAVISWSVPSYIPLDNPIISYEIGYYTITSGNCSPKVDIDTFAANVLKLLNVSNTSTFAIITGLSDNTCYIFGVHAGTVNGYGEWTVIANETLELPPQLCKYECLLFIIKMLSQQSVQAPLHVHAVMSVAVLTSHLVC